MRGVQHDPCFIHVNTGLRICGEGRRKAFGEAGLEMEEFRIARAKLLMDSSPGDGGAFR
jgi:hypothetical protein